MSLSVPLLLVGGPSAAGKSAIAARAAAAAGGEILCADSRQVYRGLDAGTAKPTEAERSLAPHHLFDIADPARPFSVADWLERAVAVAREIDARGRIPIAVGGTGLYLRRLRDGLCPAPPASPPLRAELAAEARAHGPEAVHRRLADLDPASARRIHPRNLRYTIRALEVAMLTGRPLAAWQDENTRPAVEWRSKLVVLTRPRASLRARIEVRAHRMLAGGWRDEVRSLLERGVAPGSPALRSVGYSPLVEEHFGRLSRAEAERLVVRDSGRYVKRQLTWFRKEPGAEWIDVDAVGEAACVERLIGALSGLQAGAVAA